MKPKIDRFGHDQSEKGCLNLIDISRPHLVYAIYSRYHFTFRAPPVKASSFVYHLSTLSSSLSRIRMMFLICLNLIVIKEIGPHLNQVKRQNKDKNKNVN